MKNVIPFRGDEVLKYSIYRDGREDIHAETLVEGTDELSDILTEAYYSYGIYKPSSNGYWSSNESDDSTYKTVVITKSDGDRLNQEENDFITALLNKGVYSNSEQDDYAWSDSSNFGVGGWITDGDDDLPTENSQLDLIAAIGARVYGEPEDFNASVFFEVRSAVDELDGLYDYGRFGLGVRFRF